MIIEIPDDNSIVKWKYNDKDEWKVAEISDLIKAYERPQGEWISVDEFMFDWQCSKCQCGIQGSKTWFCPHCGADMRGKEE